MPTIIANTQEHHQEHVHSLIECSFPKDFCGFVCHKQCKLDVRTSLTSLASHHNGPKPMATVSSQIREKFSFSRILSNHNTNSYTGRKSPIHELDDIVENEQTNRTSKWWKKKSIK
ncbi:uncharacterized protein B0P05DRAFT_481502 [Gilbertella persicaria]|uniref:uncharacterized protein n=1 Tax=Gilbertella persicaria TaxID=101096 RepID=UPI00221FD5C4|nr:uncharacterized protein B0P05DRAFT_481502 [Gilbertella persicaria]KAI8047563.1 hypothetical protein B0P05DRAFT_481502 [Gilbertella persicaria]